MPCRGEQTSSEATAPAMDMLSQLAQCDDGSEGGALGDGANACLAAATLASTTCCDESCQAGVPPADPCAVEGCSESVRSAQQACQDLVGRCLHQHSKCWRE
eukprot:SAG31_NODE_26415_length_442_cov_2.201166_1_plen_101_part_01